MKKLNLILLILISCILFSCQPKKEKKQPIIYNSTIQNYKYDDEELKNKKTQGSQKKKPILEQTKIQKIH